MRLDPEVKKKWLEALTNGKYKKGKRGLKHGDEFCCLGVYSDVIMKVRWSENDTFKHKYRTYSDNLPEKIIPGKVQCQLIMLNDYFEDWSKVIDYIKRYM